MKIYGYARDENGNFEKRKRKVIEFSKLMNLPIDKMIYEQSSENYEDMAKIRKLLGAERDFILLVSDTSDLFEDDYARLKFCNHFEERNVFLIDAYYPNLDYKMLMEKNCKDCPTNFLTSMIMVGLEVYFRKKMTDSEDEAFYSDLRMRLEDWKRSL